MKKTVKFLSLVIVMVLFSCSVEPTTESETDLQAVAGKAAKKSTVAILERAPTVEYELEEIKGSSSTIHRNKNGITVNFKTKDLIPGNAYTMWFVVFGEAGGPPYNTHAAGHIVGGSGNGNFSAHLSVGDILYHPNPMLDLTRGFDNPLTAEVHMALRTHGPAQPGMIPDQIQTIDGGCTSGFPSGPVLYADSDVEGYCANIQVGIHPPN